MRAVLSFCSLPDKRAASVGRKFPLWRRIKIKWPAKANVLHSLRRARVAPTAIVPTHAHPDHAFGLADTWADQLVRQFGRMRAVIASLACDGGRLTFPLHH